MSKPYLSVVIPCYNEGENLRRGVLDQINHYLSKQKYKSEVIISDDGSSDESVELIEAFLKTHPDFCLLKNHHAGKPFAVRSGIEKARGEVVLLTDMDQSTPLNQVARLLPFFDQDYEVVIGSRGQKRVGFSVWRQISSGLFGGFRRIFLLRKIIDTQCGFKAFKNKAVKNLFSRLLIFKEASKAKGWRVSAYDVELLFVAKKRGYRIAEVAVKWEDRDVAQGKERRFFKESKEMLKEILRVKLSDVQGKYD